MQHYELLQDKTKQCVVLVNCRAKDTGVNVGWAYIAGMIGKKIEVFCDRTGESFTLEIPEECQNVVTASVVQSKGNDYFLRFV